VRNETPRDCSFIHFNRCKIFISQTNHLLGLLNRHKSVSLTFQSIKHCPAPLIKQGTSYYFNLYLERLKSCILLILPIFPSSVIILSFIRCNKRLYNIAIMLYIYTRDRYLYKCWADRPQVVEKSLSQAVLLNNAARLWRFDKAAYVVLKFFAQWQLFVPAYLRVLYTYINRHDNSQSTITASRRQAHRR